MDKAALAVGYFKSGYNCSQSVLLAFSPDYGVSDELALRLSSGFGAGMGRLREVCGAVSAAFMVLGLEYGSKVDKGALYSLEQEFAKAWKDEHGSIICRDLLGLTEKTDSPTPEARTEDYYKRRPCAELVGYTAGKLDEFIKSHGTK